MPADPNARYFRQSLLPGVGAEGQDKLRQASVLILGAGGLGSPVGLYLAAAGVGRLVLVDDDRVEASNLHRQILYDTADVGLLKVDAAARRLCALNPEVEIETHGERFTPANAPALVGACTLVVDGSDNFATRYTVSDACVREQRPCVHASALRFEGQVTVLHHAGGPCYRCLYPHPPPVGVMPSCVEGGVLGPVVGTLGALQATEALKVLLGIGNPLAGRLLVLDALQGTTRIVSFERRPDCPSCGNAPTHAAVPELAGARVGLSPEAARNRLRSSAPPLLLDVREPAERDEAHIGGHLISLGDLPDRLSALDRSRPILVYCKSGARSAQAVDLLRAAGFDAQSLEGGLLAWQRAGLDLEA